MAKTAFMPESLRSALMRRRVLKAGAAALAGALITNDAAAARGGNATDRAASPRRRASPASLLDQFAVSQVIARERLARETQDYDMEAACFHPDAIVDVSWFSGTAAEFVETGRKAAARGRAATSLRATYFDALSPPVVWTNGDRAIADASCAVHAFSMLEGVEIHMTAYTRLLWRAKKYKGEWLIYGLRGIYLRDTLEPADPTQALAIDQKKLAAFRRSYRFLSYMTTAGGGPVRDDRAGSDRPDLVAALRGAERNWLEGKTDGAA